jgi:hypothetical protein
MKLINPIKTCYRDNGDYREYTIMDKYNIGIQRYYIVKEKDKDIKFFKFNNDTGVIEEVEI